MSEKIDAAFDDILETSLNDIEDLPEYLDYAPTGMYMLEIVKAEKDTAEVEDPENKDKKMDAPVIRVVYEVVEVVELKDPSQANLVKARTSDGKGSYFSESFFFHKDKKKSSEIFKAKYKEIAAKFGFETLGATLEGLQGTVVTAMVVSNRSNKDKEKFFLNTKNIQPV